MLMDIKQFLENTKDELNTVAIGKPRIDTETAKILTSFNSYPSSTLTVCPVTELPKYYEECAKNPEMDVSEKMKFEIIRYSTFSSLKDCPVAFMKLSKAGFYYDNASDAIKCFKCGYIYKNIQSNDDPMEIHYKNSPNCEFVQKTFDSSHLASREARVESPQHSVSEGACGGPSDIHQSNSFQRENTFQYENSNQTQSQEVPQSSATENQSLLSESNYLTNTNTSTSYMRSANSAQIPSYPVAGHTSGGNQPKKAKENSTQIPSYPVADHTSGGNQPKKAKEIFRDLGICVEKPKCPKYSILATRIASFKNWPVSNIVSPEDLSKAGFYYNGSKDTVCCFFCGGKLAEWERGDDPWSEHAHWFPNCKFVQQCKGDSFFKHEQNKKEDLMQSKDPFQSAAFQSVMEMGYTKEEIKTVYNKIENKENLSAVQLLELLLDAEDQKLDKYNQVREACLNNKNHAHQELEKHDEEKIQKDLKSVVSEYEELKGQTTCKVCLDEDATVVFLPCGHMCTCVNCAPAMRKCPICRSFVKGTVKAILS